MSTPTERASNWLSAFASALARNDAAGAAALFDTESHWRDLVAFSWNLKTVDGRDAIAAMLKGTLDSTKPTNWKLDGEASEKDGITDAWFTFETVTARGRGHVRLKGDKAWTLLTTAQELKGFEEKKGRNRWRGTEHGVHKVRKNWLELKTEEEAALGYSKQPYVLIIGGGQGGIALGARLKRLGVPTIIVEKNERPGDSWRKRYKSLCLHDPVWYDHLPYLPFPDDWPVFSPKDKIGDWLESYVKIMELNYWTKSACKSAQYDPAKKEWTVEVLRDGKPVTLRPKQLVLATGQAGVPNMPDYPGMKDFKGTQRHSSQHPGGEDYTGRKCVVVGSNNSAHDIAADLWENGADVTMVQRSSTHVSRSESLMEVTTYPLWGEEALEKGITTEKADLIAASIPYKLLGEFQKPLYAEIKRRDADFYERLKKAGFMLDFGDDESGLFMKYVRRGSGYYIDVGASELICNGSIKLKQGKIERITPAGLKFADGSELPADLIVYATGYGSMNGWAAQLISKEVADKVGKCWGLGSDTTKDPGPWEGELRNMWKPTQQEGLWFHGGNLHQSRHYSQFLSLQLKARMEGLPTPVYGLQPVHHLS
ncbi:flavin-containing monooxygenase [Dongia sedimenti]|uniref:NAD(P)/FAD-dependent oxidoreductase n=1 Tax=Dongia sedimenti TaxID=3064282 RepID=A0ABU0YST2_9PROT|nr:NAD(P)/FAD-dependent oxidoreductase [Rhodospirillaceae bacterium R-7]